MVRSYWLGPVSALLALSGQAAAQPTPTAQPTPPAQPQTASTTEQVLSVRELNKPVQKCKVLTTTRQPDGSIAWLVETLTTHEKMLVIETTVTNPQGSRTSTTRIVHLAKEKNHDSETASAPAVAVPAAVAEATPTPATPTPAAPTVSMTTPATATVATSTPPAANRPLLSGRWFSAFSAQPTSVAEWFGSRNKPADVAPDATSPPQVATNTKSATTAPTTEDWRKSWGYTGGSPAVATPSTATVHAKPTPASPDTLPLAQDHGTNDPLARPKAFSKMPLPGMEAEPVPSQPASSVAVAEPALKKPTLLERIKQAGTETPTGSPIPAGKVAQAAPAEPQPARTLWSLFTSSKPTAPTPAQSGQAQGPMMPPGMGSVVAVRSPELAFTGPPTPPAMAPVAMDAYESNAFCTPTPPPKDQGPVVPPRQFSAGTVSPGTLARLPHGQPPGPPVPPDPTGTAMLAAPQGPNGYPMGGMVPQMMPAVNYPPTQMAMATTPMPIPMTPEQYSVRQASATMPLEANVAQLTSLLREAYYPSQREWAASQLGLANWRTDPGIVVTLMRSARSDMAPMVRAACVHSLGMMTASDLPVADVLKTLRQDPDAAVRQEVDRALEGQGR